RGNRALGTPPAFGQPGARNRAPGGRYMEMRWVRRTKCRIALALAVACTAPLGCADAHDETANVRDAIINGTLDTGDPAVAQLVFSHANDPGDPFLCSSTVIAPNVLLTAAHCVVPSAATLTGSGPKRLASGVFYNAVFGEVGFVPNGPLLPGIPV